MVKIEKHSKWTIIITFGGALAMSVAITLAIQSVATFNPSFCSLSL